MDEVVKNAKLAGLENADSSANTPPTPAPAMDFI